MILGRDNQELTCSEKASIGVTPLDTGYLHFWVQVDGVNIFDVSLHPDSAKEIVSKIQQVLPHLPATKFFPYCEAK